MARTHWLGFAVLGAVVVAAVAWMDRATTEVQVTTSPVTTGPISRRVVATGTLQAVTTVEVGAQLSGIVQSIAVDFNSLVHAGQVLARLDPASYEGQLREAQAALRQAQAALLRAQADESGFETEKEDAQTKLGRAEALAATHLITESDADAARILVAEADADRQSGAATVAQSRAAIVQAQAVVDQASVNLANTYIRSPIEGIVIDREVDVGQTLAVSLQAPTLFRIAADLRRMQIQVDIDEGDIGGLTVGDAVTFDVESYPDESFTGVLSQVRLQPVAEVTTTATTVGTSTVLPTSSTIATVVTYTAIVDVANPKERLRPGMTAEVVLPGARREHVVRIPNGALSFRPSPEELRALNDRNGTIAPSPTPSTDGDHRPVQVWTYDGKQFTPILVSTGLADDGWTELVSGSVTAGDGLVTNAVVRRRRRW